jgi:hypothetical protein
MVPTAIIDGGGACHGDVRIARDVDGEFGKVERSPSFRKNSSRIAAGLQAALHNCMRFLFCPCHPFPLGYPSSPCAVEQ